MLADFNLDLSEIEINGILAPHLQAGVALTNYAYTN